MGASSMARKSRDLAASRRLGLLNLLVRVGDVRPRAVAGPRGGPDDQAIKRHLPNVLTYFRHRITNAMSEGIASKIQALKKMANGFRNRDNFKTAIYFHCGGLDLYPEMTH